MAERLKSPKTWVILLSIFILHSWVLNSITFFPYPELFIYPYLTKIGLVPYTQILDQHFPGLMFFPVNLATLGMSTPEIAKYWQSGIIGIEHVLIFLAGVAIFKSRSRALIGNVLFLLWHPYLEGYVLWIDSFVSILLLGAFLSYYLWSHNNKTNYLLVASFSLGFALIFKQVVVPLILFVAIYGYFKHFSWRNFWIFSIGVGAAPALMLGFIINIEALPDFIFWTATFNLTTFAQMGRKFPAVGQLARISGIFGFAVFSWLVLLQKKSSNEAILLGIFFLGSLFFAYARFDFIHLQPALPFAILLMVMFIDRYKLLSFFAFPLYLIYALIILIPFYKGSLGGGTLFFGEKEAKVAEVVRLNANAGDSIFALATTPHIYQLTNTRPAGDIFVFQFPWFMTVAEQRILNGLKNDPPRVVIRDKNATTAGQKLVEFMPRVERFIDEHYTVDVTIDEIEVLLPK